MKKALLIALTLCSMELYSQETVQMKYESITDRVSRVVNDLNGIKMMSVLTYDTAAYDKKIILIRKTYTEGIVTATDTIIRCEVKEYEVVSGDDILIYKVDICDRLRFDRSMEEYKIIFASKFENDSINSIVSYPSLSAEGVLEGDDAYQFRALQPTGADRTFNLTLSQWTPIIALTPAMKLSAISSSFCLIDGDTPDKFYENHGIAHYYIYFMKIE